MNLVFVIGIYLGIYSLLCLTTTIECSVKVKASYELDRFHTIRYQTTISYCEGEVIQLANYPKPEFLDGWLKDHPTAIFSYSIWWGYLEPIDLALMRACIAIVLGPIFLFHVTVEDNRKQLNKKKI